MSVFGVLLNHITVKLKLGQAPEATLEGHRRGRAHVGKCSKGLVQLLWRSEPVRDTGLPRPSSAGALSRTGHAESLPNLERPRVVAADRKDLLRSISSRPTSAGSSAQRTQRPSSAGSWATASRPQSAAARWRRGPRDAQSGVPGCL